MGKNLEINLKLEKYIEELSYNLHPIQQEIIKYNESLGDIKRMQISVSQCHFLHLIIKISKIKKIQQKCCNLATLNLGIYIRFLTR